MKSLTRFLKESFSTNSEKAPEIVTKHLGLKFATGEGNSEQEYIMAGSKGYMERGKVDGLDNVFVTVGWYNSLLRKDASIFVYTTAKANSKTMRLAACYGLDQNELERKYKSFNSSYVSKFPNQFDVSKFGEFICVRCKDIDDMVENIRNDWGKGSKSYKQSGWLKENNEFIKINGVYQSFLTK